MKRVAAVLVLLLAVPGCRVRNEVVIDVREDGSGELSVALGADEAARSEFARLGHDPIEAFRRDSEADPELPPGTRVERWVRGDFEGVRVVMPFQSLTELDYRRAPDSGRGGRGVELASARREGHEFRFRLDLPAFVRDTFGPVVASLRADPATAGYDESDLVEVLEAELIVRVPGRVVEHNAERVEGGALVWRLVPFPTGPALVRADLGGGGRSFPVLTLAAPVLVGGALLALRRRRLVSGATRRRAGAPFPPAVPDPLRVSDPLPATPGVTADHAPRAPVGTRLPEPGDGETTRGNRAGPPHPR